MQAELRFLLGRVQAIQSEVGPSRSMKARTDKHAGDTFMEVKSALTQNLKQIADMGRQMHDLNEEGAEEVEKIKLSMRMYDVLKRCQAQLAELAALQDKERTKRASKFTAEDLELRDKFIANLRAQINQAVKIVRSRGRAGEGKDDEEEEDDDLPSLEAFVGVPGAGVGAGAGAGAGAEADEDDEDDELGAGHDFGAGAGAGAGGGGGGDGEVVVEALTQRQEQVLANYQENKAEMETKLGEIEKIILDVGELAEGVYDEAVKQGHLLDELQHKVESATGTVERAHKDLSEILKQVRGADKLCMDIVCCILLFGVATVIYNIIKRNVG